MSYTIEYTRQFVRSGEGITPCWLAGDNNVTEGRGRYERRVRNWSCFLNLVGASEEEVMAKVQSLTGGPYQEHWKKNGKWVDDKGLINWAKNGIRNAASIEEILEANPACCGSVQCSVVIWRGFDRTEEARADVRTTDEFDAWVRQYRAIKESAGKEKFDAYPIVDFGAEKLRVPVKEEKEPDTSARYHLRKGRQFLSSLEPYCCEWTSNPEQALTFSYEEAMSLLQQRNILITGVRIIKVPKGKPQWSIIQVFNSWGEPAYVCKMTSRRLFSAVNKDNAYRYSSPKSAQAALDKILRKYPGISQAKIIQL